MKNKKRAVADTIKEIEAEIEDIETLMDGRIPPHLDPDYYHDMITELGEKGGIEVIVKDILLTIRCRLDELTFEEQK
jgi:hypothetical protein